MVSEPWLEGVIRRCSRRWGEDATQDALEWLVKCETVPEGEDDFARLLHWKARLQFLWTQSRERKHDSVDKLIGVVQCSQLERAIAREMLERCEKLVNHEMGEITLPKVTRWRMVKRLAR